jgi:iron only hydrogenase large subunit-like protein
VKARHTPVDYVITVRELAWLLKKNRIELENMEAGTLDYIVGGGAKNPLFGASGGETDAVFSAASHLSNGRKNDKLEQDKNDLYRDEGIKTLDIELAGRKWRTAVVNGIGNIKEVLENHDKYDFIEVRACPGGCVGGGGQAFPTDAKIRKTRLAALRKMDKHADQPRDYSGISKWAEENAPEDIVHRV